MVKSTKPDELIEFMQTHHVVYAVVIYRERGVIAAIEYLRRKGVTFETALEILSEADNCRDLLRQDKPIP